MTETTADGAIRIELDGAVALVTLARAEKRNALAIPFWEDFPKAIRELDDRGDVRAIVLASDGPVFCSGIDLDRKSTRLNSSH